MPQGQKLRNTEEAIEEFSIMELDERLEFVAWTDKNCNCTQPGVTQ